MNLEEQLPKESPLGWQDNTSRPLLAAFLVVPFGEMNRVVRTIFQVYLWRHSSLKSPKDRAFLFVSYSNGRLVTSSVMADSPRVREPTWMGNLSENIYSNCITPRTWGKNRKACLVSLHWRRSKANLSEGSVSCFWNLPLELLDPRGGLSPWKLILTRSQYSGDPGKCMYFPFSWTPSTVPRWGSLPRRLRVYTCGVTTVYGCTVVQLPNRSRRIETANWFTPGNLVGVWLFGSLRNE